MVAFVEELLFKQTPRERKVLMSFQAFIKWGGTSGMLLTSNPCCHYDFLLYKDKLTSKHSSVIKAHDGGEHAKANVDADTLLFFFPQS